MPLVTTKEMLTAARAGGYAVGAFNAENMEIMEAVVRAAEKLRSPVILQSTPAAARYASTRAYAAFGTMLAERAGVPVAIHLDHGDSLQVVAQAYRDGYSSVMIDGSQLSFEENIALTQKVVELCGAGGVPVEAELGKIGGQEDDVRSDESVYTDPTQAAEFIAGTRADSLAVGVGTAHGVYAQPPVLNLELISRLKEAVPVPLVLHGASGLADEVVTQCAARGICKVNFATELRVTFTESLQTFFRENPAVMDPKVYGAAAREAIQAVVEHKIRVCGSQGKG